MRQQINVRLPEEIIEAIKQEQKKRHLSQANVIIEAVKCLQKQPDVEERLQQLEKSVSSK